MLKKSRTYLFACCYVSAFSVLLAPAFASAQTFAPTSRSKVEIDLCPEYRFGGVALDVYYTIGNDPTQRPAPLESLQFDSEMRKASAELTLPTTMGNTPFKVYAYCRDAQAISAVSNTLSISNCNVISQFDTDLDGLTNNFEDTDCNNAFSPGDASNVFNVDTDGDGVRDLVEVLAGKDPANPGSSPRPYVYSSAPYDPDADGNSNSVVWRSATGTWFINNFITPGNYLAFNWGKLGDIPFSYVPEAAASDVGVIRATNNQLRWLFHGVGYRAADGRRLKDIPFGLFGDNIILGPWEVPGVTNIAVTRLFADSWQFFILKRDGTVRVQFWGGNGDIPKVQDYDGDGIFDIAVFRPASQQTFIIKSTDGKVASYQFGTGTAEHTVRGDFDGDGIDDISFWESTTGLFFSMTSSAGFDDVRARAHDPSHYFELQLGVYSVHLPLNWNYQNGVLLYTVVDHATGYRYYRPGNLPSAPPTVTQWGINGDHQG